MPWLYKCLYQIDSPFISRFLLLNIAWEKQLSYSPPFGPTGWNIFPIEVLSLYRSWADVSHHITTVQRVSGRNEKYTTPTLCKSLLARVFQGW